jgi:hypothetical protein
MEMVSFTPRREPQYPLNRRRIATVRTARGPYPGRGKMRFFSSRNVTDRLWGPSSFLLNRVPMLFPRGLSGQSVMLTVQLLPTWRSGVIPQLPLYAFMARTGTLPKRPTIKGFLPHVPYISLVMYANFIWNVYRNRDQFLYSTLNYICNDGLYILDNRMHFKCVCTKATGRYEIAKNTFSLTPFLFIRNVCCRVT